jgi:hypothetical protein
VACVGGWLVLRGQATVGVIVAGLQYVAGLFGPIQGLTGVYATVRRAGVSLDAVTAILDAPDALADPPRARDLVVAAGTVEFRHVSFGYDARHPVLHDVSLVVHPGETVALVGPSGCGKTTLVSLLERLHAPTCGRILIDGQDVGAVTQRSLRRQVGTVVQDVHLFRDTVLANITYGCPGATRADAEGAARAAHAHEFILRLPQGYDTVVGERGAGLSGGQRPAPRHRPRAAQEPAHPRPRRGDERARPRERGARAGRARPAHARPHHARRGAPVLHGGRRRSHRRAARRAHRGRGHARGAARARRLLRAAVRAPRARRAGGAARARGPDAARRTRGARAPRTTRRGLSTA